MGRARFVAGALAMALGGGIAATAATATTLTPPELPLSALPLSTPPLTVMERLYKPLLTGPAADLGWALKVDSAAKSELKFSTSTRELFYLWAREHCADWLKDPAAYVLCHGDVHLGNVGTYVVSHPGTELAIGLKDFDESCLMPFQTDLLQAAITLRLTARKDGLELDDALAARGVSELVAAYGVALRSGRTATEALRGDREFSKLLAKTGGTLLEVANKYFDGDAFRPAVRGPKGDVRDLLRPALRETDAAAPFDRGLLGAALARAAAESPGLARLLVPRTGPEFESVLADAALRYRLGSGGSQGQLKILVRLSASVRTLAGTTDAVLYLKEQCGSAAMRAGYVKETAVEGGRRNADAALALCSPQPGAVGWVTTADHSFVVTLFDPWEDEPSLKLDSEDNLLWAAHALGTILGAAHRSASGNGGAALLTRIGPTLQEQVLKRSADFASANREMFRQWKEDGRVPALLERAKQELIRAGG